MKQKTEVKRKQGRRERKQRAEKFVENKGSGRSEGEKKKIALECCQHKKN